MEVAVEKRWSVTVSDLQAIIIYTAFLIKKIFFFKSLVASAASLVVISGLPLRSRSLWAEDQIQNQE